MPPAPVATAPRYRAVLRNREFRALWLVHGTSTLGDQVTRVVLAALVLARSHSVALSALSFATAFLPWLIGGPALALLADRCPRRTVMVACDLGRGLLIAAMTVPGVPVWALLALAALAALLGPAFEAARGAALPDVLTREDYPVAQSLSMASLQGAQVGGFALAGGLLAVLPGAAALRLDSLTFFLSAAVIQRSVRWRPGAGRSRGAGGWWAESGRGAVVVARAADLRWLLALTCVSCAVTVVPEGLAVAQARSLDAPSWAAGVLAAALPLGSAVGALALTRWVPGDRRVSLIGGLALLATASTAAVLLTPGLPVTLLLWVLAGVGSAGSMPANVAFVLRLAPDVRGRALAVGQVCLQVSQGTAVALGGLLATAVGPTRATGLAGVVGLLLVAALLGVRPRELAHARPVAPRPPAAVRVWVLAGLVLTAAAVLWQTVGRWAPGLRDAPLHLPWLALLPLVVAAQAGHVHFQVRRQAQSVALCHLPIVIGLVCCTPGGLVAARVLGGALAMGLVLGQRGIKLGLNTASYALEAVVAVSLLSVLPHRWPAPALVYVVMLVADTTSLTVVTAAIALFEHRLDPARWLRTLVWLVPINLVASSVALLAVATLWRGIGYLPLLVGVAAALLWFYRTYARLRSRHVDLGRVQDLAVALPALTQGSAELADAVEQARLLLLAETAQLRLRDGSGVVASLDEEPTAVPLLEPRAVEAVVRSRWPRRPQRRQLTARVEWDGGSSSAELAVHDRLGAVRHFDEDDDRLLTAVAALLGGALDRGSDRQRLLDAARRDPLTSLWTLPEAARRAADLLGRGELTGVLLVDVMGLQDVNDSLGHDAGDALLVMTADRLRAALGPDGFAARVGGDELLALMTSSGPGPEEVLDVVAGPLQLGGPRVELRLRGGFCALDVAAEAAGALTTPVPVSFELLLRHAYAALARAVEDGWRWRSWTSNLELDPSRRLRLASDLQTALARGDVTAVFQPLVRARDRVVVGAEALARWAHPQLGPVPPDEFVAIAEQTGLVLELTRVVLAAGLEQARRWRLQAHPLRVSVNVSARSLADPALVALVDEALVVAGLPADALLLEITETAAMGGEQTTAVLAALRARGIELALDDFGTGYSSLAHLHGLPAGEVKLDRRFVGQMTCDPTAREIVRAAVALCHELDRVVVAEGVEDEPTVELLTALGVDVLQGFHLGRPVPAEEWDPALVLLSARVPAQGGDPALRVPA